MTIWRQIRDWVTRWQMTIVLVAITAVFFLGLRSQTELRREDARIERTAALRFCEDSNVRTQVLLDFLKPATADPDPRQYDFIQDPVLREGAIDQARRGRVEMRERVSKAFVLRNCPAEFPAPPDGG